MAIPTETVYGLAGRAQSTRALRKIFQIKKRPFFNPLILHCANITQMRRFHRVRDPLLNKMIAHFCPGPLTFVLPKTGAVHPLITAGRQKVGLRIPKHPLTLTLLKHTGALCAPSANMFTRLSPTRAEYAFKALKGQAPVLNGGACKAGIESTVIEPDFKNRVIKILRPGPISKKDLRDFLKAEKQKNWKVLSASNNSASVSAPLSPGSLKSHYRPAVPLILISCTNTTKGPGKKEIHSLLFKLFSCQNFSGKKIHGKNCPGKKNHSKNFTNKTFKQLKLKTSPALMARALYHELNVLSQKPNRVIYILQRPGLQNTLDWEAIWNRLKKACTQNIKLPPPRARKRPPRHIDRPPDSR